MQTTFDLKHYAYQGQALSESGLKELKTAFEKKVPFYQYLFKRYLGNNKNIRIIDIPCGHGNILYFLKSSGYTHYEGYDIDEGRVMAAKSLGLNASVEDGLKIVKHASDVDVIFSLDFMEHLEREMAFDFAADCLAALKQGGVFIMRMPVTDSIRGAQDLFNDITHKWSANSEVIRRVLLQYGFKTVDVIDERPVPYKFVNKVRRVIFNITSFIVNIFYLLLGFQKVKVWSTSCFFVCTK